MEFQETGLHGLWRISLEKRVDDRGFFARSYCYREFGARGIPPVALQCNISSNAKKATLRGMHFQKPPRAEGKLVRCTRGAIYDVVIDLRKTSPTYLRWMGFELTAENYIALYIPAGFAHGFQTLVDDTEIFYQMSEEYVPDLASGVRWNDPAFNIDWPLQSPILSPKDAAIPDYDTAEAPFS